MHYILTFRMLKIIIYVSILGFIGALAKFLSKLQNKFTYTVAIVLVVFDLFWHALGKYIMK